MLTKKYFTVKGAIAAGHPLTVAAGETIFEAGGNAFDAMLAAMLASCVTEPMTTSAGGGGFALAYNAVKQKSLLFDFFTQTPQQKRPTAELDFFPINLKLGDAVQTFHIGMASAAVPGFMAGWFHIHQRLGNLPIKTIIEPAVKYAREGVEITDYQANTFKMIGPIATQSEVGKQLFQHSNGGLKGVKERYAMPLFADTIEYLAKEGARAFYEGEIAQQIVKDSQAVGGHLSLADFKDFEVIEREPLSHQHQNNLILTNPPPCSGGLLITFALALLDNQLHHQYDPRSKEHVQLMTEVMRLTGDARKKKLDDFIYDKELVQNFLAPAFVQNYQQQLMTKRGCTTHISTLDDAGNAMSVTTSFGEGCGYFIPNTHILLNNMLGEEDLNPNGFHSWLPNQRLSSMMSPTIVLDKQSGKVKVITGTGGANRIRTAILQVLHHVLHLNMDIQAAVDAPRLHFDHNHRYLEPGFYSDVYDLKDIADQTHFQDFHHFFGGAHSIFCDETGQIRPAGDSRRDGRGTLVFK